MTASVRALSLTARRLLAPLGTAALIVGALPLGAQTPAGGVVAGVVRDADGQPIGGAEVTVEETGHQTYSNAEGAFRLPGIRAGTATLHVRRLGFRPSAVPIAVTDGGTIDVPLVVERVPQTLSPVVVEAGRPTYTGRMADFYRRRDLGLGGHFFTYEQIMKRNPMRVSDLFRTVPGLKVTTTPTGSVVTMRGRRCTPLIWLDGAPASAGYLDTDVFDPRTFEGIEIYMGASTVPAQLMWVDGMGSCGVIALWTKMPEPKGKKAKSISAEELAALVATLKVYTAEQVDQAVMPDTAEPANPRYPETQYRQGTEGRVLAEFVVDTTGLVEMNTFGVVSSSNPAFTDAVRSALRRAAYHPAVLKGVPVRQVVQQAFRFVLPEERASRRGSQL